jgi:Subtilase family
MAISPKIIDQYNLLIQALPDVRVHPADWLRQERDYEYLYLEDSLLMRTADKPALDRFLVETLRMEELDPNNPDHIGKIERIKAGLLHDEPLYFAEQPIQGLTKVRYTGLRDGDGGGTVPDLLARLEAAGNPPGMVRPVAVVHICGNCCPAHEPLEVPAGTLDPVPAVAAGGGEPPCNGAGVTVNVVDTGWIGEAGQRPWLHDVTGDAEVVLDAAGNIQFYAGHGTFSAGCVRVIAPEATVRVDGIMTFVGATYEDGLVAQLEEVLLAGDADRVVVFPFSATTRDGLALFGFDQLYENVIRKRRIDGMVIISSAGCDNTPLPSWPAAYKWVVSVGALATEQPPVKADFSNFGPFVDVYVLGQGLVNAFATGPLVYQEHADQHGHHTTPGDVRNFAGMAMWCGTSFSTGLLGGMVAARKSQTGETARAAADALLDLAEHQFVDGLGPVLRLGQACAPPQ